MKWQGRRTSSNIEDRRGRGRGAARAGSVGIVGLLAIFAAQYFLGIDISPLVGGGGQVQIGGGEVTAADEERGRFAAVVLADTETIWADVFRRELGRQYAAPTMVLFSGQTQSPCGGASAATGPFYCPVDKKVYLDTDFFVTMDRRLGAKGDFAAAYVVAHEVAHHVQNILGVLPEANRARQNMGQAQSNQVSVMIELQADCFSGIWARAAEEKLGTIEQGDLREAVNAAKQIGDDTLQRNAGQVVRPESFTHGTSEQRVTWFARGYQTGELAACDTFNAANL